MTKKNTLVFLLTAGTAWLSLTSYSNGASSNGNGDLSNQGCSCHGSNNASTNIVSHIFVDVTAGGPVSNGMYVPGRSYAVSIIANNQPANASLTHFGFQITARTANGNNAGAFTLGAGNNSQLYTSFGLTGVEHATPIAKNSSGFFTETFLWTAPATGTGPVTFHTALNAVNNDNTSGFDQPNIRSVILQENTSMSVRETPAFTGFSLHPNPAKDRVRLGVQGWNTGAYNITILDVMGKTVLKQTAHHDGSTHYFDLALPHLTTGLYALRIHGPAGVQAAPLFIR